MSRASILVIDRNQLFREGLKLLLQKARFTIGGDGKDLAEALEKAGPDIRIDLLILTVEAAGAMDASIAQIDLIRRSMPSIKLVGLAASLSTPEFMRATRSGVDAILPKDISGDVLHAALTLVLQSQRMVLTPMIHLHGETAEAESRPGPGDAAASPPKGGRRTEKQTADEVSNLVPFTLVRPVGSAASAPPGAGPPAVHPGATPGGSTPGGSSLGGRATTLTLSHREAQILLCLVKGFSNKLIARELEITEATVKVHLKGLMRKVGAANRTQAAIWAINNYFTTDEVATQKIDHGITRSIRAGITGGASNQSWSA